MFEIYRNLHRFETFSIRENGKVVAWESTLVAHDVQFVVSESGRQRVLKERRKNVHAVVRASRYKVDKILVDDLILITYNPYLAGTFMCGTEPIFKASAVAFSGGRCYLMIS